MHLLNLRIAVLVVEVEVEIAEMAATAVDYLYAAFESRRPNLASGVERDWKENQERLHYALTWNGSP